MRAGNLNEYGQPYSKKQRKASRRLMAERRHYQFDKQPGTGKQFKPDAGLMAGFLGLILGAKRMGRKKV